VVVTKKSSPRKTPRSLSISEVIAVNDWVRANKEMVIREWGNRSLKTFAAQVSKDVGFDVSSSTFRALARELGLTSKTRPSGSSRRSRSGGSGQASRRLTELVKEVEYLCRCVEAIMGWIEAPLPQKDSSKTATSVATSTSVAKRK